VWARLHEGLCNWLRDEAAIHWSRASVDSLSVRAKMEAMPPAPTGRIAASPHPNATWSLTGMASPWPTVAGGVRGTEHRCIAGSDGRNILFIHVAPYVAA
jgi:hypothetical protein